MLTTDEEVSFLRGKVSKSHSEMSKTDAGKAIDDLKKGNSCVVVTTALNARGIDVSDLKYVIQWDVSSESKE